MLRSFLVLSLFALVTACAQTPKTEVPPPLMDTTWRLVRLDGREIPAEARAEPEPAHLRLAQEGRVTGSNGCNRFFGQYRQTGDRIEFAALASTRRACLPGRETIEGAFMKALGDVRGWKQQGRLLHFYGTAERPLMEMEAK